ncbi:DKNYY domain-containing protein [Flavobacterium aquidurense]|uniref:Membrane protein n=1 Tax=Flavobacterium aquidurense TaxID=362413 RepID=A0A0Q0S9D5_9FLAO|nr:DKNYY domain-containing protein [Flavobacterium aquidurense]KQB40336.1 Membrane protein [Flavobacterium aquidurense]
MKVFYIILAIVILVILAIRFFLFKIGKPVNLKISNSYFHHYRKKLIVYSPLGNWFELGYFESTADVATFQPLNQDFGKDKNSVFWKGRKQLVDCNTFEIDGFIIKDKNYVYNTNGNKFDELEIIKDADPKTYQLLDSSIENYQRINWFKDINAVYYKNKKIEGDPHTFKPLNDAIAIDANFIYAIINYRGEGIEMLEVNQVIRKHKMIDGEIRPINETYVQIGNSVVSAFTKAEFELHVFDSITTVKTIDYWSIIVDNVLICKGIIFPDVDAHTFEVLDYNFSKDKSSIYYDCEKINHADYSSFKIISDEYSKDAKQVYFKNNVVKGANPETIKSSSEYGIWEDENNKYKNGEVLSSDKA